MQNNYYFLRKLAAELSVIFVGKQLLTCFSQEKDEIVLGFSNDVYLKCILKPDFSAITLVNDFSRARKNSVSLWEVLYGRNVIHIGCFENERALRINLEGDYVVVIKLFGNRPNLLIYKSSEQIAIFNNKLITDRTFKLEDFDRAVNFSFEKFKEQEGDYRKMFFTFGKDVFDYLDERLKNLSLNEKWSEIQDFLEYLSAPKVYIDKSSFLPKLSLLKGEEQVDAVSAVNSFVSDFQKVSATDRIKSELSSKLQKDIVRTGNYISNTSRKLEMLKSGVKNEELGNILMANLHQLQDGLTEVELDNFYTGQPINIKLKKELSPQKNAEAFYRKSKNEKIEIETAERNLNAAEVKMQRLKEQLDEVKNSDQLRSLRSFSKNIIAEEKSSQKAELPFKEYIYKNTRIWVGRNAKNNDLLLTQYAQKDDWWLHARDVSGSHVVVKSANPSTEILEYAASLAACYSKRKSEKLVTVIYTQKKYVRKAKNLPAGKVIVEKEKTLLVEPASL